ncbi:hypothetical protein CsatA_029107 [Cannabis sativa]
MSSTFHFPFLRYNLSAKFQLFKMRAFHSSVNTCVRPTFQKYLRYAVRILFARLRSSIAPDSAAIAESIKSRLANQGKSSQALTFFELYNKFESKTGPGSVNNKWAVLHLLNIISEDRKNTTTQLDSSSVLLPNLAFNDAELGNDLRVSRKRGSKEKGWNNGVLLVSKDPENLREIAFKEFVNLLKEENEISEEVSACVRPFDEDQTKPLCH